MNAWIAAKLAWLWAKAGTWLAIAGGVVVALLLMFAKGRHSGKQAGKIAVAEQAAKDAQAAQQVTVDAAVAADKVRQDAAKQSPPDTEKRDDLDNSF